MDKDRLRARVEAQWRGSILAELVEYVRIPAKSPAFDPDWQASGHLERAMARAERWASAQPIPGLVAETRRLPGRTPLLLVEIPGTAPGTVLLYGHLDKQPEMEGWREGLGPWEPVIEDGRLYGRGGADDGYALFAAIGAIAALAEQGAPYPRCVVLVEASEESGSPDLPAHVEALAARIGEPDLVVCLDSGCGDYRRLWQTTSLRGMVKGTLRVRVMQEGVHSGDAGGVIPSAFRIARSLLERIEDAATGTLRLAALRSPIPELRRTQAARAAEVLGEALWRRFPLAAGLRPEREDLTELVLRRTWEPALAVIGAEGLPPAEVAGNVALPELALRLSLRLAPRCDAAAASAALAAELERDPPYGATVRFEPGEHADGWEAPPLSARLEKALDEASRSFFGEPAAAIGEGGTIPFMGMLAARFPRAQFVVTGVLGPQANAHGPNEFLDLGTAERLSCCVAALLEACAGGR